MKLSVLDDELNKKAEEASVECLQRLCPHTWQMPSGNVFPVDRSITRTAFVEGVMWLAEQLKKNESK